MDIYQIMARLDAIGAKKTLTESQEMAQPVAEGRFKELDIILQDYPEDVETFKQTGELSTELYRALFDFYENQMDYGTAKARTGDPYEFVSQQLADALGLAEAHEKLPVDQLGLDKFSQAALSGGQRKRDALANPERARMLAKKSAQQQPVKEVMSTTPKKGDRVSVEGKPAVIVGQIPTQAGQAKYWAVRFDSQQYPGNTYDQVHANKLFPADVAEDAVGEGNAFSKAVRDAKADGIQPGEKITVGGKSYPVKEAKGSKPDFLDLDKDGNKKEPMKKAAKDKNDAKGAFQKQMGGSAKELTKGLSIKEAEVEEGIGKKIAHGIGKAVKKVAPNWVEKQVKADDEKQAKAKKSAVDKFTSIAQKDTKKIDEVFPGTPEYELRFGKDDASSAFDKKKISTGTVYSRKHQEEPEAADDDTPKKKGRPVGAKRRLGAKGPGVNSKLLKGKGGLKEQETDTASDAILPLLKKFISIKSDPADKQDLIKVYKAFEKSTELGMKTLKDQWGTNLDAEFYHYAKQNGIDMNDFDSDVNENIDPADRGEYDREGDMALNQMHQIADAVKELHSILDADDNLPEWVQSKITKALDYIDTARDYLDAKGDQKHNREPVKEKAVSKAQQKFMGMVHAAKKGAKPASKEVAKVAKGMGKKDAEDFAATKHKGLPEKKKKDVEETTVAGSVATGGAAPAKSKGGMQFGKGVYEGALAESFERKLSSMLNESTNLNISTDDQGQKSVTVSATGADADSLSDMLKMAGLFSSEGYSRTCEHCHGIHEAGACSAAQVDEELANSPDEQYADTDTMINKLSGGLNGPKLQVNPNNPGDNPLAMRRLGKDNSGQVNLSDMAESVEKEAATRLWDLYKRIQ